MSDLVKCLENLNQMVEVQQEMLDTLMKAMSIQTETVGALNRRLTALEAAKESQP